MTDKHTQTSSRFYRSGSIFIVLSFLSALFELGFNGIAARLPEGGYGVYNTLNNLFFMMSVPLLGIQLMVSKEVSGYNALSEPGKARYIVERSLVMILLIGAVLMIAGVLASPFIARYLMLDSVVPVVLIMMIIGTHTPIPVLLGTIQGTKRFMALGIVALVWGIVRFGYAALTVWGFKLGLNGLLVGFIAAVFTTMLAAIIPVRSIFKEHRVSISTGEMRHAFSIIIPIAVSFFCVTLLRTVDMVFARRFFDPAIVNAYGCAVRVGMGFFTLSGIFLVMSPLVSEEKSLSRNPVHYLFKSIAFTAALSCGGIAVAWLMPGLVMRIITLGTIIPGAEPLIKIVGIVIVPVSLTYIMANYFLAQHRWGFIVPLMAGTILQIFLIQFQHDTPIRLMSSVGIANYITLIMMAAYLLYEQRRYHGTLGQ